MSVKEKKEESKDAKPVESAGKESKHALLSKTNWLGLALVGLAVLQHMETIPDMPKWSLAVIGVLIVALRTITSGAVNWLPKKARKRDSKGRFTSASIVIIGLALCTLQSCSPATCSTIRVERHPHPAKEAPAKRIVLKCGGETVEWHIDSTPECMNGCFR